MCIRDSVRAAAFRLFGTLARFGQGPSQAAYRDQIEQNFVPLLVHINDPEQAVVSACKTTLKLVCPLLPDSVELNKLVAESVQDDTNLHFGEFGNELMKRLVSAKTRQDQLGGKGIEENFKKSEMWF